MYARGAIFGLDRSSSKEELVKAALDAMAFQTRDVLDAMKEDSGAAVQTLKVDGGAVANNYLMQFQADILQVPVERPSSVESTALGAACLAGTALGVWTADDISKNKHIDRVFEAEMEKRESEELYKNWKKAVARTLNWLDPDS